MGTPFPSGVRGASNGDPAHVSALWVIRTKCFQTVQLMVKCPRQKEVPLDAVNVQRLRSIRGVPPAGAAFVSTMPAPSGFLDGAGCEKIVGS